MFQITSKQAFVVSDGMLYIDFKCHHVSAWLTEGSLSAVYMPRAVVSLKIGDKYWNGTTWTTNNSSFELPFTSEGAKNNRSSHGGINAPQYNGYGIPVTDTIRGVIEFKIIDAVKFRTLEGQDINGFLPLMDFKIGFVRGVIEDTKHRGNEYVVKGGRFSNNVNVDLIFASDVTYGPANYERHMPAGVGYILNNSDEKPAATVASVDNQNVIPEDELAQVIAKYGEKTHRLIEVNLWSDIVGNVEPTAMSTGLETGMFPIAISHDWRDDITTITMIEL
jgi:hypothetical protein